MNLTKTDITQIANSVGLDYARLMAFISVESGGQGFTNDGHLIIQFEPVWFHRYLIQFKIAHTYNVEVDSNGRKKYVIEENGKRIVNGVEGQTSEWIAFNTAFSIHPKAAMLSTSIGMTQIMGFNYRAAGYNSVDEMYDAFKKGEYNHVQAMATFIKNNSHLYTALRNKDWKTCAYYYNGENYAVNHYDSKLAAAYLKYNSL